MAFSPILRRSNDTKCMGKAGQYYGLRIFLHKGLKRNAVLLGSLFKQGKVIELIQGIGADLSNRKLRRKAEELVLKARNYFHPDPDEDAVRLAADSRYLRSQGKAIGLARERQARAYQVAMEAELFEVAMHVAPSKQLRAVAQHSLAEVDQYQEVFDHVVEHMRSADAASRKMVLRTALGGMLAKESVSLRGERIRLAAKLRALVFLQEYDKASKVADALTMRMDVASSADLIVAYRFAILLKIELGQEDQVLILLKRFWLLPTQGMEAEVVRLVEYCRICWIMAATNSRHDSLAQAALRLIAKEWESDHAQYLPVPDLARAIFWGMRWLLLRNRPAHFEGVMEQFAGGLASRSGDWIWPQIAVACHAIVHKDDTLLEMAVATLKRNSGKNASAIWLCAFAKGYFRLKSAKGRDRYLALQMKAVDQPSREAKFIDLAAMLQLRIGGWVEGSAITTWAAEG